MGFVIVDEFAPVVVTRRVGVADEAAIRGMLARTDAVLSGATSPVAFVYDAGHSPRGRPDARARQLVADWMRGNERLLRERCAGLDFAFPSPLSRGVLTAIFWITPPLVPYGVHASCEAALTEALGRVHQDPARAQQILAALDRARAASA